MVGCFANGPNSSVHVTTKMAYLICKNEMKLCMPCEKKKEGNQNLEKNLTSQ